MYRQSFYNQIELKIFLVLIWVLQLKTYLVFSDTILSSIISVSIFVNLLILGSMFISDYFTTINIEENYIEYRSGIFIKNNDTFKIKNIRDINETDVIFYYNFLNITNIKIKVSEGNTMERTIEKNINGFDKELFYHLRKYNITNSSK